MTTTATTCHVSFWARDDGPKNWENHARIDGLLARANMERRCQDGRSVWACWRSPLGRRYVTERDGDGWTLWALGVGADDAPLWRFPADVLAWIAAESAS